MTYPELLALLDAYPTLIAHVVRFHSVACDAFLVLLSLPTRPVVSTKLLFSIEPCHSDAEILATSTNRLIAQRRALAEKATSTS